MKTTPGILDANPKFGNTEHFTVKRAVRPQPQVRGPINCLPSSTAYSVHSQVPPISGGVYSSRGGCFMLDFNCFGRI